MFERTLFSEEHEMFRQSVRRFVENEIVPHHAQWEKDGIVSRDLWLAAGDNGLLGAGIPEEYGGSGAGFLFTAIVIEELARVGATGPNLPLHSDIVAPYIVKYGSEAQKRAWLPKMAAGETIGAIAMSEPAAGSDLRGIKTVARKDGDEYVISGQKVFISNGHLADLVIVCAKTDPSRDGKGMSLFLVERGREGFERGRNMEKIGYKAQDTAELYFNDVRVPAGHLLGEPNGGFAQLMEQLPQERLIIAVRAAATLQAVLDWTLQYTMEREAFGRPLTEFQNTRFELASVKTSAVVARVFVDRCIELHVQGKLSAEDAAVAKLHCTELQCRMIDRCLQLHGGYGYMWEYPIARAWADSRMSRIAGGTSEIMKEIISRNLVSAE